MYNQALATDYDGTLATDGRVDEAALAALDALRVSGRKLILVSGREQQDLLRVFPSLHVFDRVVLENGAVLIRPGQNDAIALAEPPPQVLVEALRARGVSPLSTGNVIISTWEPNETVVLEVIREHGLEHQVIFNKGAVMVLPPGVNKATGLAAALDDLRLSLHNVVGIGDAENDQAFLRLCGCAAAVANALPSIKEQADIVTSGARGAGVREIAERLVADDLANLAMPVQRHRVTLAVDDQGRDVVLPLRGAGMLVAGTSGSGKSTLVQAVLERLAERKYQYCVIDPEGDYQHLPDAFTIGDRQQAPRLPQVLELLERPDANVTVNLLGIPVEERPVFFDGLLAVLLQLRLHTGRPHWIIIDEAHHLLPASAPGYGPEVPKQFGGMAFVTVHPDQLRAEALATVDLVIAVGKAPRQTIEGFCRRLGQPAPEVPDTPLAPDEALAWRRSADSRPVRIPAPRPRGERRRHIRKYAVGELGDDKSFYFRGPDGRLNLRAQNLTLFLQLGAGVDDATWLHHLRAGDYSRWLLESIKDDELAAEAAQVEADPDADPASSRERIRAAIERRYTGPASGG
jgi:hydroxymethylpyrimidine pyrophosphatase-like HAD family hydrolase